MTVDANLGSVIGPAFAVPKGAYNSATAYVNRDMFYEGGVVYLVHAPVQGVPAPNAAYYQVFLPAGPTSPPGPGGGDVLNSDNLEFLASKQTSRDNLDVNSRGEVSDMTAGFRNKIINGGFDIWQRGEVITSPASGQYVADRWYWIVGGGISSVSRQNHTLGQTDVPGNPKHFMRTSISSGGDNHLNILLEGVETLSGGVSTLSFYTRFSTSTNAALEFALLTQGFGSGGSPSGIINAFPDVSGAQGTAWAKTSVLVTLPSIAGKNLGTNLNDHLNFRLDIDPAFVGDFDISRVSLVQGDATVEDDPFSPRHVAQEKHLCERFYRTLGLGGIGTWFSSTDCAVSYTFPEMRATPTVAALTSTGSVDEVGAALRTATGGTTSVFGQSRSGLYAGLGGFSGATVGKQATVITDKLIALSAEL